MPKAGTADKNPSPPQQSRHTRTQLAPPHLEIPKREALQKTERAKTVPPLADTPGANAPASAPDTNRARPSCPSLNYLTSYPHTILTPYPQTVPDGKYLKPKPFPRNSTSQNP